MPKPGANGHLSSQSVLGGRHSAGGPKVQNISGLSFEYEVIIIVI